MLASLNHPNIGAIYGLEKSGDTRALVLELIEGPTLADRIAQGPIPVEEALPIAKQIAEALEAAHEAGVIHRDLKPANIKVRDDGTVKVLDFGLAKALDTTPQGDPSLSPTLTAAATQMGVIMGTAAYMSPEQARGKPVDRRADIWAFGAVLYEMLTGQRAFEGEEVSLTLSAVLQREPEWTHLPDSVPPVFVTFLRSSLMKDPRQRLRDIGDIRLAMDGRLDFTVPNAAEASGGVVGTPVLAGVVVLAVIVGAALAWALIGSNESVPGSTNRFAESLPSAVQSLSGVAPLAISGDGRHLVFAGTEAGHSQLFLRSLERREVIAIRGAKGNIGDAFLSPHGRWVGFRESEDATLKKVLITGGTPVTVCRLERSAFRGADWGSAGMIAFATSASPRLMHVSEEGGDARPLTPVREGEEHWHPHFLPDGRAVLYTVRQAGKPDQIAVLEVDSGQTKLLLEGSGPQYVASGHLLFLREGAVWAIGFDFDQLEPVGSPQQVLEQVEASFGRAKLSVSLDGTLVYVPNRAQRRSIVWTTREGQEEPIPGTPPDAYEAVRLSRDGTRLAIGVTGDIAIYDFDRAILTSLTRGTDDDRRPIFTVDGQDVLFESDRGGTREVFSVSADGTRRPERLATGGSGMTAFAPSSFSPDGSNLLLTVTGGHVMALDMNEKGAVGPFINEALDPAVSPDGLWVAHGGFSRGVKVFVQPYPELGRRQQISPDIGWLPRWSSDSHELFYMDDIGRIMSVQVPDEVGDSWGVPDVLIEESSLLPIGFNRLFDVAPDGRFVVIREGVSRPDSETVDRLDIELVQHWFEELKRLVPTE